MLLECFSALLTLWSCLNACRSSTIQAHTRNPTFQPFPNAAFAIRPMDAQVSHAVTARECPAPLCLQDARHSLGINLRDAVIVVDEAHNLVDAVNGVHSATITALQLRMVLSQLEGYWQRFQSKLGAGEHVAS